MNIPDNNKSREQLLQELASLRSQLAAKELECLARPKTTIQVDQENLCQLLFETVSEGFALHEIILGNDGKPCDYRFLGINPAFELLTGLKYDAVINRTVREVIPEVESYWIETYGKVALEGESVRIENYAAPLKKWYEVYAYRPKLGQFAVIFSDVTERKEAEESFRQRAEEVERLLDAVPAAVLIAHDPQCQTITGNRKANEFCEAQPGENVSATAISDVRRFFTPDGREIPAGELPMQKAVATNQDVRDVEFQLQLPAGRRIAMLGSAVPLRDRVGNVRGCIGAFLNITERKRAEESLRESEARFRNMADNAPVMVWVTESDGACTYLSQSWYKFTGQAPEAGLGSGWVDAIHPDDRTHVIRVFEKANKRQEPFRIEYRLWRSDGAYRWIIDSAIPRISSDNRFLGYIGSVIDITERKQAEQALRESEERFRALAETSPLGVGVSSAEGKIIYANRAYEAIIGCEPGGLLGQAISGVYSDPADRQALLAAMKEKGKVSDYEVRFRRKDGSPVWVSVSLAPIEFGGKPAIVGAIQDVTERKRAKEAVVRLNETLEKKVAERTAELELRNREISALAHKTINAMENDRRNLSKELHDSIGGTLAAILYQLESLREQRDVETVRLDDSLDKVIFHLHNAIGESRRITKQMRPSVLDDFGLVAALEEHLSDFKEFHPDLQVKAEIDVSETEVAGDASTVLYRVVQESLNNVAKHSGADTVQVQLLRKQDRVQLIVRDNGAGFNPDEFFGPVRATETYGLHSMKERVEICKGEFSITSAPGKGTSIDVIIPVQ